MGIVALTLSEAIEDIWTTLWTLTDGTEIHGCVMLLNVAEGPDMLVQLLGDSLIWDSWSSWPRDAPEHIKAHCFGQTPRFFEGGPPQLLVPDPDDPESTILVNDPEHTTPPRTGRRWLYLQTAPLGRLGNFHNGRIEVTAEDSPAIRGLIDKLPEEFRSVREVTDEEELAKAAPRPTIHVDLRTQEAPNPQ